MSYPESVRYLYSLGNEVKIGAKLGLERMQTLLDALGNPERGQRFIHVAGTNGKGSTCAMIANALRHAGLRTGLYTSPHLIEPTERIHIDGTAVTASEFDAAFRCVHETAERLLSQGQLHVHPSYFETVTAMALCVFRDKCDISVLEVGLGGRLDATNVVMPQLCVITPIAFDHESFLGSTIELIAGEKAGILKPGVPLVLAKQPATAEKVICEHARELDCPVVRAARARVSDITASPYDSTFRCAGDRYICGLAGRHQIDNAVTAVMACKQLDVSVTAIQNGLRDVRWPGRLEYVSRDPDFVLDGAHNPAGAAALASYIREFCADRTVWLVYAAMRDKAIDEVTSQLFPLASSVIATAPNFPRALRPETIVELTEHPNITIAKTVGEAIDLAGTAPRETIVFFTGSLFLVGEARALLTGVHPSPE